MRPIWYEKMSDRYRDKGKTNSLGAELGHVCNLMYPTFLFFIQFRNELLKLIKSSDTWFMHGQEIIFGH